MEPASVTTEDIAHAVRGAISRANETIERAATRAGLSRTTMTRRMTGHSPFTAGELIRIAAVLDINLSDIVGDAEKLAERRRRANASRTRTGSAA